MNRALEVFTPVNIAMDLNHLPEGVSRDTQGFREGVTSVPVSPAQGGGAQAPAVETPISGYVLLNAINSPVVPDGKYFYNPNTGRAEIQWTQGIGSTQAAAPQARLMATVINGILTQKLPWGLILIGVFIVIGVELLGVRSLSFAVGFYLSIATTLAIFCGGVVRWLVERSARKGGGVHEESEVSPGSLYSSGLIAAGGIMGLIGMAIKVLEKTPYKGGYMLHEGAIAWGARIPYLQHANWLAVVMFGVLAYSLYHFARKPLDTGERR
jgi:hypothetical protein